MPSPSIKPITDPIDRILRPLGFTKQGKRRWIRETAEIIQSFSPVEQMVMTANIAPRQNIILSR